MSLTSLFEAVTFVISNNSGRFIAIQAPQHGFKNPQCITFVSLGMPGRIRQQLIKERMKGIGDASFCGESLDGLKLRQIGLQLFGGGV